MRVYKDELNHNLFFYLLPTTLIFLVAIVNFFLSAKFHSGNAILFLSIIFTLFFSIFIPISICEEVFLGCKERKIISSFFSLLFLYYILNGDIFFSILNKIFLKDLSFASSWMLYIGFLLRCINSGFIIGFCIVCILVISKYFFEITSVVVLKSKMSISNIILPTIFFICFLLCEKFFQFLIDGGMVAFE